MGLEQRHRRRSRRGTLGFETVKRAFILLAALATLAQASLAAPRIHTVSSLQKLTATTRGVLSPFRATPARLRAARGEWEYFQIVVTADAKPLRNLSLVSTPLATPSGAFIATNNIEIYRENFVLVSHPSGNRQLENLWWPDALIPLGLQKNLEVAPHTSEVFWVAVQAPREATPGHYGGAIDISADGEKLRSQFFTLEVENSVMPAPTLRANVAVYYDILRNWYAKHLDQPFGEQQQKQYYDFLLDYRLNAYDLPVAWDSPNTAKYLNDPRVLSVRLPPLDDPQFPVALKTLRANNALTKAYFYWIDEPSPDEYSRVRATAQRLRAIDPQMKQCVTVHPNPSLQGAVDIWCPNIGDFFGIGHLDFSMLEAERKKGNETWWYTMVEPKYPYPTWLLDDDASSVRVYGALMAKYGITGFVYSMAHGWGPKPLENLESFASTNGDGTLLYPAELVGGVGPLPSIRLMLLRDAIEDYELMRAGLKPIPTFPNGLLREKIVPKKIVISRDWARHSVPLLFDVKHDTSTLFVRFPVRTSTLEKEWCAVEIAPEDASERFRFVVTAKGNAVVEKHTREGRFRLEGFDWKFAASATDGGYEVEMQIPLSIVDNAKRFRFNALHRDGSTLRLTRAFPDAGDVTLMPFAKLDEPGA
jgi:hypothetical protein